jgi:hypothetical protein
MRTEKVEIDMKKDKRLPFAKYNDIDENLWDKMVKFTEGFGYMILYLSIFIVILMMIKDVML